MRTRAATTQLANLIATAIAPLGAVVVTDPDDATGHLLAGTPVVVIGPPKITDDTGPTQTYEWETPIIGAPINDRETAWDAVDHLLEALDPVLQCERASPITWTGAQTSSAPAYLLTHTQTIYKES